MTKKAIIIGASSGIGLEVARILLEKGWQVGVAARRTESLEQLRNEYPNQVVTMQIDVTAPSAGGQLLQLAERVGGMHLYFHAAGVGWQNPDLDGEKEMTTVYTNVEGFMRMVGETFRYMATHDGGHIAVISSIAGTKGLGPAASYSATKAFQNTYIEALEQLAATRRLPITFTDIRPGFVDTPMLEGSDFPMKMNVQYVARKIVRAIERRRHVSVIDWRYRLLVFFWRLVPRFLWRRLRLIK